MTKASNSRPRQRFVVWTFEARARAMVTKANTKAKAFKHMPRTADSLTR